MSQESVELLINTVLLLMMVAVVLGIVRVRNLFAVVMLGSVYSFLMATLLVVLDAVDVSMTEAAVGAGISTVLMLSVLGLTQTREAEPAHRPILPLIVAVLVGAALVHGTSSLPEFGDPGAPSQLHVAPEYIERAPRETGAPNIVTAVLASYRGYDTLGETTVIFTAGIGVLVLLAGRRRKPAGSADGGKTSS
jgi:multicomponent Na+:H+ antiporter subunit B